MKNFEPCPDLRYRVARAWCERVRHGDVVAYGSILGRQVPHARAAEPRLRPITTAWNALHSRDHGFSPAHGVPCGFPSVPILFFHEIQGRTTLLRVQLEPFAGRGLPFNRTHHRDLPHPIAIFSPRYRYHPRRGALADPGEQGSGGANPPEKGGHWMRFSVPASASAHTRWFWTCAFRAAKRRPSRRHGARDVPLARVREAWDPAERLEKLLGRGRLRDRGARAGKRANGAPSGPR